MESMTPKERWIAVLNRRPPDRIPMDYWGTTEITQKLLKHLGCENEFKMFQKLHIDNWKSVVPIYFGPSLPKDTDMYGCKYKTVNYGAGSYSECVYSPLAKFNSAEEIKRNYTWPSVDFFDYTGIERQLEGFEEYPICGGGSEPFLVYKNLRGQELAFMDLVLNSEIVHYCLDKLFDFCYQNTLRIYEKIPGKVLLSYIAEDMGGQEDLMFSPEQIHEFLIPRMKRMINLAHSAGVFAFHHSDGAIRKIIPDMIEAGIDILNPIQWRCKGMERDELKRDFGNKVIFHGGVDNQQTLAFGTVEEVKREVRYNLEVLGADGGYILAPCHNIQSLTLPENVVALYETGYENG